MMTEKIYSRREAETIADIATLAGYLLALPTPKIAIEDSRELVDFILESAREFEVAFTRELAFGNTDEGDYMERVDEFARKVLIERYGKPADRASESLIDFSQTWTAFVVVGRDNEKHFFVDANDEFGDADPDAQTRANDYLIDQGGTLFKVAIEGRIIGATMLDESLDDAAAAEGSK